MMNVATRAYANKATSDALEKEYKIIIGDIRDLENPPPENVVAVCSCINHTDGETEKWGKPFLGLDIGVNDPIRPSQFDDAISFIKKYITSGDVMVACRDGECRSVSVAIAYYAKKGMTLKDAKELVGRRPYCSIHGDSLLEYLNEFYALRIEGTYWN